MWPTGSIRLTAAPAGLPAPNAMSDVAIAVAVLAAAGAVPVRPLEQVVLLGELGLDGWLRPTPGILPAVLAAVRGGIRRVVVPADNAGEARLAPGAHVYSATSLAEVLAFLRSSDTPATGRPEPAAADRGEPDRAEPGHGRSRHGGSRHGGSGRVGDRTARDRGRRGRCW